MIISLEVASITKDRFSKAGDDHAARRIILTEHTEVKQFTDFIINLVLISVAVNSDILLPSISTRNFFFHFLMLVGFIIAKVVQGSSQKSLALKITDFTDIGLATLITSLCWFASWFRELQERSVAIRLQVVSSSGGMKLNHFSVITFQESARRLETVREAKNASRRRADQSAAEEVLGLLDACLRVINRRLFSEEVRRS